MSFEKIVSAIFIKVKIQFRQIVLKNSTFGGTEKIKPSKMATLQQIPIAGRVEEIATFGNLLNSTKAELVAVYGRRRVGKTFLIRQFFKEVLCFEFSGTINTVAEKQLYNFAQVLGKYKGKKLQQPFLHTGRKHLCCLHNT